jgi:prolyl oligopeptidase
MRLRALAASAAFVLCCSPSGLRADDTLRYPVAERGPVVTDYFGTKVPDPYRWMEDIDSAQTRAWVTAEGNLTDSYLAALPTRAAFRARLRSLFDYERVSAPSHQGNTYLISRNGGLQNQSVTYVSQGADGPRRELLDPNVLSTDGTVALGGTSLSYDGKLLAYATQVSGSDWQTWHVRDVATLHDLPDVITWAKFSGASWNRAGTGFYYSAYDAPANGNALNIVNANQKVYFHALGTPQSADVLVYARPDHPDWFLSADATEDGHYLMLATGKGNDNGLAYIDLRKAGSKPLNLFPNERATYDVVDNDGPLFFIRTNAGAPNGKLIAVDLRHPRAVKVVIPESDAALQSVTSVGGRFFANYLKDAHTRIVVVGRDGIVLRDVALPGIGTASGFGGHRTDRYTYYSFAGYTMPTTIYRYEIASGSSTVYYHPAVKFDPNAYATEQIFYTSKDGTRVPMFVSYKKGLVRDGRAPAILTAYGGFDIPITPSFSPAIATWLEAGGIYAVPNIRGGSEYGEAWHRAGMLSRKQNVFDDFIAAAQTLIDRKYTSTPRLAIQGGSNGGLLMGAVETQRPELFGAVLANVGVMDMLRFDHFTVGAAWVPEYGSSEANAAQFKTLFAYSPVHNVKPGTVYPPTLISTGDHDDRVFPAHSFKFAAAMQAAQAGPAPILLFVESKAGHGGGKPLQKALDEIGDQYAFLAKALNFTPAIPAP